MPAVTQPRNITRAYDAKIDDVLPGSRAVVAKVNTNAIDRYRTVICPKGGDLKAYRQNPVVLWEHGMSPTRGSIPIGTCHNIKIRREANDILARTVFGKDDFAEILFGMYQDETLRGFSVNILPDYAACSGPTKEEIKERPELVECGLMFRKWELAEYSGVGVPGNPEALAEQVARGLWIPEDRRKQLDEIRGKSRDDAMNEEDDTLPKKGEDDEDMACYAGRIMKKEGKYCVYDKDGKCVKEHASRADGETHLKELKDKEERSLIVLPPLVGRTFEQAVKEMVSSIRTNAKAMVADAKAHIEATNDLKRGRV